MVDLDLLDGVAVIRIDNPPVNALSEGVRNGLYEAVKKADADDDAKAILIICTGRTYIAGADIREFGKPHRGVVLFDVQDIIEGASKPVVSTIHGTCLGGGLEVAICCHYRVAVPNGEVRISRGQTGDPAWRRRHSAFAQDRGGRKGFGNDGHRRNGRCEFCP